MNWIFETYSNVYSAAMMQGSKQADYLACAKVDATKKVSTFSRLFGRR